MFLLLASAWDAVTNQWDRYESHFIAAPLSPLLIPAIMIAREERQVLRRDETYPTLFALWVVLLKPVLLNLRQQSRH